MNSFDKYLKKADEAWTKHRNKNPKKNVHQRVRDRFYDLYMSYGLIQQNRNLVIVTLFLVFVTVIFSTLQYHDNHALVQQQLISLAPYLTIVSDCNAESNGTIHIPTTIYNSGDRAGHVSYVWHCGDAYCHDFTNGQFSKTIPQGVIIPSTIRPQSSMSYGLGMTIGKTRPPEFNVTAEFSCDSKDNCLFSNGNTAFCAYVLVNGIYKQKTVLSLAKIE